MTKDITGRVLAHMQPDAILADMMKAAEYFGEMLNMKFSIDVFYNENRFEVLDAGVDVMIDQTYDKDGEEGEDRIFISTVNHTPGTFYARNGDPGNPPETDYVDNGDFALTEKNDAINCMVGQIAVNLFHAKSAADAEEKFFADLEAEREAAENGGVWEMPDTY